MLLCILPAAPWEGHLLHFWALPSSCQRSNSWSEKENQHTPVQTYSPLQNSLNFLLCRSTVEFHCISHKLCLSEKLVINYTQIWELELKKGKRQVRLSLLGVEILKKRKSRTKSKASDQDWTLTEINKTTNDGVSLQCTKLPFTQALHSLGLHWQ